LALFSCLFITKDEFIHNEESGAWEQWLHSILFVLHPIVLLLIPLAWKHPVLISLLGTETLMLFTTFLKGQLLLTIIFFFYQVLYWNISWKKIFNSEVDNDYYHHLGEDWLNAKDDPIALLRAESKIKNPWVIETIKKELGNDSKAVLDIGCGAGFLSNAIALEKHHVHGIDMSEESLAIARKYDTTKTAQYQSANAYSLPFENNSFDVVCAIDFLEHVEEPEKVIAEASRVLRPGGIFFFHTFSKNLLAYFVIIKLVEWFLPKTPKNLHILRLFISPKQLKRMNELANLKTIKMFGIRPRIEKLSFWISLFKREVHNDFSFAFTKSTLLSYIGYAQKEI